jgi:CubicO group peptidase (beta-lactamase class C family)
MARAYKVRKLNPADHDKIPFVTITAPDESYHLKEGTDASYEAKQTLEAFLDTSLENSHTTAFLVIRNDSILYERYFNGFSQSSLMPSYSVAKSFVATLFAMAYEEGKIKSLDEPVTGYIPELLKEDKRYAQITLRHILDMRTGLRFYERQLGLKDNAIKLAFQPDVTKQTLSTRIKTVPGEFEYQSVNTQLLAMVVERATGKTIQELLQEKLWQPLGAETTATWNVDKKGRALAFSAINATARDFAKLGLLYLHNGAWNGRQLVSPEWIRTVNNADSMHHYRGYHNQWWSINLHKEFKDSASATEFKKQTPYCDDLKKTAGGYKVTYRTNAFSAIGMLSQYIYVNPDQNMVIVRLGHGWEGEMPPGAFLHMVATGIDNFR